MTGGNMFGLEGIQSDDELLDRLAARESSADDELEALLGAWVREIEDDADEVAGTPMPWMGQPRPRPRSVKIHRAAAVAGALVVTLSGGMAAVALMPTETQPAWSVGVLQGMSRILPKPASTTASTVSDSQRPSAAAAMRIGTREEQAPVVQPTPVWTPSVLAKPSSGPGLPPLTTAASPTVVPTPTSSAPVPPSSPGSVNPPSTVVPTTVPAPGASENPTATPEPTVTDPSSEPVVSPEPTPSKTSPTPVPPVKDSSPVTTPGGVHTEDDDVTATPSSGATPVRPTPDATWEQTPSAGSVSATAVGTAAAAQTGPVGTVQAVRPTIKE